MTPSERLLARLTAMGVPLPEGAEIRRTYAGWLQRRHGAWSWAVDPSVGAWTVGSQWPVTHLLRARRLVVSRAGTQADWDVDEATGDVPAGRSVSPLGEAVAEPVWGPKVSWRNP